MPFKRQVHMSIQIRIPPAFWKWAAADAVVLLGYGAYLLFATQSIGANAQKFWSVLAAVILISLFCGLMMIRSLQLGPMAGTDGVPIQDETSTSGLKIPPIIR